MVKKITLTIYSIMFYFTTHARQKRIEKRHIVLDPKKKLGSMMEMNRKFQSYKTNFLQNILPHEIWKA